MRKISFALITLFWVTMNVLLWRAEFSGKEAGVAIPVSLVWEKILTSPDDSALAVHHGQQRIGYCRWIPNIGGEAATGKTANENAEIEGRIKELTGYTIHAEGNFILPEEGGRFRFDLDAKFAANHEWSEWSFKGVQRPNAWKISANRATEMFQLELGEGAAAWKQAFRFADLREPQKIAEALGLAATLPALGEVAPVLGAGAGSSTNAPARLDIGLQWEARQDWLQMGHSRVRVYRLEGRALGQYRAVVIVSRVGEILRVELPGEVTLVNEALINL